MMTTISELLLTFVFNALWQIPLVAAAAGGGAWLLRRAAARYRHLLWVLALVLGLLVPLSSLQEIGQGGRRSQALQSRPTLEPASAHVTAESHDGSPPVADLLSSPRQSISFDVPLTLLFAGLYISFLFYRLTRLCRAWRTTKAICRAARRASVPAALQPEVERCHTALGVRETSLLCSPTLSSPVTVGLWRPAIIFPERLLTDAAPEVLTAALGHELAHVRRRDFGCNLACELLYLPVSFHPAAALVRRRIGQTRELACDEMVSERLMDARAYARSLVSLAGSISSLCRPTLTLGVNDADILEERVMRLIRGNARNGVRFSKALLLAAAVTLGAISITAGSFTLRVGKSQKTPKRELVRQPSSTMEEDRQNLSARELLDRAMKLNRAGRWREAAEVSAAVVNLSAASQVERCEAYTSGAYAHDLLGEKEHALNSATLFEKECADLPADSWQSQEARRIMNGLNGIAPTKAMDLNRAGRWAEAAERAQEILNTSGVPRAERCGAYVDAAYAYVRLKKKEQAAGVVSLFEQDCGDLPTDHWQQSELRKLKAELE